MISRRHFVAAGFSAGATAFVSPLLKGARADGRLAPTPAQPIGPFYPVALRAEHDNDLSRVAGASDAAGQIVHVLGTVRNTDGAPLVGARIEIWQCDAGGYYHHPDDRGGEAADPRFQGYGTMLTAADGAYRFRTIHPVPYTGRTPHIHVIVSGPGLRRLVTQLYVAGAPTNVHDGLFSRLDAHEQARLLVDFQPVPGIESNARVGRFDIVVEHGAV